MKETINKTKSLHTDRKILVNDATDKELLSKSHKLNHLNMGGKKSKTKQLNQQMDRKPKQTFLQRRHTLHQHG